MRDLIINYIESTEYPSYKKLNEIFGLDIYEIGKLLTGFRYFKETKHQFRVYDKNHKLIYINKSGKESWAKYNEHNSIVENRIDGKTQIYEYELVGDEVMLTNELSNIKTIHDNGAVSNLRLNVKTEIVFKDFTEVYNNHKNE